MLSMDTINSEILNLEKHDTTFATCEKLAWLYIVRDHLNGYTKPEAAKIDTFGDSDFMKAISGRSADEVWRIMDELMDTLKVVNPRLYDGVMRRIQ